jgi:DNA-binding transcriptional ArsR family regulator
MEASGRCRENEPRIAPGCATKKAIDESALIYNHLVMQPSGGASAAPDRLGAVFAALADPTRRSILARLSAGDASVMELAQPFAMSQPAISKHLKVLERAGLISRGRDAQRRPCRIEGKPFADASEWLEGYRKVWERNFERLDALLEEMKAQESRRRRKPRPRRER